jgi:hypothetical protein
MKDRFPCDDVHRPARYRKEQILLGKLYEAQEIMSETLDKGVKDPYYRVMEDIIHRLEQYLQNQQDIL